MRINKVLVLTMAVIGASLACNAINPAASQAPATEAPGDLTAPAPPAAAGASIVSGNVSFVVPADIASGAEAQTFPRAEGQDVAPWDVTPGHTAFTLQNYAMQGSFHDPQLFVYPAQDYAALSPGAEESLRRLKLILAAPDAPYPNDVLPYVPFWDAGQVFSAQEKVIRFGSGSGVRVVTQYAQDVSPLNNGGLIYHFEGLTSDGKYYVIAVLPTSLSFLPADNDPAAPLPDGGIPFPGSDSADATAFNNYYQAATQKIEAAPADSFSPALPTLDALITSLKISP